MHSVVNINPKEPHSTPASDRKEKGSDSFSLMLKTTAPQPDDPAPEAKSPRGDEPPPAAARMNDARRNDARPEHKDKDRVDGGSRCERASEKASKIDDPIADEDPSQTAKPSPDERAAKDAAPAAVPQEVEQCAQPVPTLVIVLAAEAPKTEDGANVLPVQGSEVEAEIAIAANAPVTQKPVAEASQLVNEGPAPAAPPDRDCPERYR